MANGDILTWLPSVGLLAAFLVDRPGARVAHAAGEQGGGYGAGDDRPRDRPRGAERREEPRHGRAPGAGYTVYGVDDEH